MKLCAKCEEEIKNGEEVVSVIRGKAVTRHL